jgi:hypothetical protein
VDNFNIGEARKVFDVECYDPRNIVGFHRGDKPRIVRLKGVGDQWNGKPG